MPNDRYQALPEDAPAQSRAAAAPSGTGGHCSRLRQLAVRIPRSRACRRRSFHEGDSEAPILDEEQNCHFSWSSSSPSPSPEPRGANRELPSDIEPSPFCTSPGNLVFVDSSPESEGKNKKIVIVPPADVFQASSPSSNQSSDFESDPKWTGSPAQTPASSFNVTASSGPICRICHEGDQQDSLVSLCRCSGTMGLVHVICLERWLNTRNIDHCELCHHRFPTAGQHSCVRRFFHWALHGNSQRAVLGDLFCFALLTPVTALSFFLCTHNASKQAFEGRIIEAASLVALAGLLVTAYAEWAFLAVRFQYRAFAAWQARNPMHRILAPPLPRGAAAGGQYRTTDGQSGGVREMDVVAGSVETGRTSTA
ncbi:E3 ubiquitin-protein ligase MARCHF2-like [Dermacentor albipictus]|uniref:E3 ubiquitin-protein ligase MARCHF2-like n=1 Tax=Dermacentor albipictus TaxID=60249 RepID=UPI0038FCE5C5